MEFELINTYAQLSAALGASVTGSIAYFMHNKIIASQIKQKRDLAKRYVECKRELLKIKRLVEKLENTKDCETIKNQNLHATGAN
jgi:hypothetical protein